MISTTRFPTDGISIFLQTVFSLVRVFRRYPKKTNQKFYNKYYLRQTLNSGHSEEIPTHAVSKADCP